jgi:predicted AAA+ superfamily ATPase
VVNDYVQHHDFNRVDRLQQDILAEYRDDIAKHAKGKEKVLVRMCYDAIPVQLMKEQKKFQYSTVERGQTRKKYGGSVQWLKDSAMVQVCYNLNEPYLPLKANANGDQFKLYINDTGLLCCSYGFETKLAVLNDTITGNARGGIYENAISECLIKRGYPLYYYKPDSVHEIEFFIERSGAVIPIEVKAGNRSTPSLNQYIARYRPPFAYKLTNTQNGRVDEKITLPHYMVMFI